MNVKIEMTATIDGIEVPIPVFQNTFDAKLPETNIQGCADIREFLEYQTSVIIAAVPNPDKPNP